ncbi:hypothetical protein L1987_89479 [Smallanthus sonchifolius]|nr:hypothetical protein L1987_89479 [Smallanthus sonchifolius]
MSSGTVNFPTILVTVTCNPRRTRMNPVIQDILILELMLSSGEGVFIERGKSRVASRLTDFSESEEDLSSDHPEHEGAALDVRSAAKERRKGP